MTDTGKDLAPFVLENVKELQSGEKKAGSGAYGAVYKVTVKRVICIEKRLHDILVNPEVPRKQRESIREKFRKECVTLSKLRHPHIVHFVGVRCGQNPSDLSLVMECLHTDLAKFLEEHQEKGVDIPLSLKLSILLDVSYGLLYLHTLPCPIVHRDLSANNILLTADGLQAKVADLGVSKLLDLQMQTQIAQTKVPGSQNYMPPEALRENPQYGLKLDIFSFGHLVLYTATQEFPGVHEVTLTPANLEQGTVQIVKRKKAIDQMGGETHCLHPLVIQCLQDEPEHRPTALKLNETLKEQCAKHPRRVAEILQFSSQADEVTKERDAVWRSMVDKLQAQLDEITQKEEWARKHLESITEDNRKVYEKCQGLEAENKQLSEQMKKISGFNNDNFTLLNVLKAQARKLEQEKETLQNEVRLAKTEAESERHDREKKIAYLATHHAEESGELKEEQLQMQEQFKRVLVELEGRNEEVKQYKEQVNTLKDQFAELEGHNKTLSKEREKLFRELDKTRTELAKAQRKTDQKAKKDAEKARKKQLTSVTPPGPIGMYKEPQQLHEGNITLRSKLFSSLPKTQHRPLSQPWSSEISQTLVTSPAIPPAMDSYQVGQQPSRANVKNDEETEQKESLPLHLDEQPPIHPPSVLSLSYPEVHPVPSPASSPRTRNRPQGQHTLKNASHLRNPQWTHMQTPPIPVPQWSEHHPLSSHQADDSSS